MEQSKYHGLWVLVYTGEYKNGVHKIIGEKRDEWLLCNGAGDVRYFNKLECSTPMNIDEEPIKEDNMRKEEHYELWPGTEAWDIMKVTMTYEELIGFLKGNILKYQLRLGKKKGESIEKDLQKIETYKQILKESL